MIEKLKSRARALKDEAYAIYIAAKDPRTPAGGDGRGAGNGSNSRHR